MSIFVGSGVAITTPFDIGGEVNYTSYEKHIDFLISNKSDAIITCGTTGESSTLNDKEHLKTIEMAVKFTGGRVPVIAGTGSNDTKHGVELCKGAEKAGADALLLVTPYYNKTTQKGLIRHFTEMARNVEIPIMLYNVPGRTGLNILPETAVELSKIENIVAIKEASGDLDQIMKLASLCDDDFDIYTGNDNQVVPTLSLGGKGVISVIANIMPEEVHDMVIDFLKGNVKESLDIQLKMLSLVEALFSEVNPMPIKAALNVMGFEQGNCRLPLCEISDKTASRLIGEMNKLGLLK
ncbi:MAG: 4-hydroxy-tetrahydrodipicolinate synthase [Lachnospirales bacterium]